MDKKEIVVKDVKEMLKKGIKEDEIISFLRTFDFDDQEIKEIIDLAKKIIWK